MTAVSLWFSEQSFVKDMLWRNVNCQWSVGMITESPAEILVGKYNSLMPVQITTHLPSECLSWCSTSSWAQSIVHPSSTNDYLLPLNVGYFPRWLIILIWVDLLSLEAQAGAELKGAEAAGEESQDFLRQKGSALSHPTPCTMLTGPAFLEMVQR